MGKHAVRQSSGVVMGETLSMADRCGYRCIAVEVAALIGRAGGAALR
jgi:hypothetical protein